MPPLAAVLVTLVLPHAAADPAPDRADMPYGAAGEAAQTLDVYRPRGPAPAAGAPAVVYVHGGGWAIGDKGNVGAKAAFFTDRRWAFVSVNYRLGEAGRHPRNADDVAAAVRWVRANAADLGVDPDRVALMGHSAGAHLAALASVRPSVGGSEAGGPAAGDGQTPPAVRAVVVLDTAALDVPLMMATAGPRGGRTYRAAFGDHPDLWRAASPAEHLTASAPPFLLVTPAGNPRRRVQDERFAARLTALGVPVETYLPEGRTHQTLNRRFGTPGDPTTARAWAFLRRHTAPRVAGDGATDGAAGPVSPAAGR